MTWWTPRSTTLQNFIALHQPTPEISVTKIPADKQKTNKQNYSNRYIPNMPMSSIVEHHKLASQHTSFQLKWHMDSTGRSLLRIRGKGVKLPDNVEYMSNYEVTIHTKKRPIMC